MTDLAWEAYRIYLVEFLRQTLVSRVE